MAWSAWGSEAAFGAYALAHLAQLEARADAERLHALAANVKRAYRSLRQAPEVHACSGKHQFNCQRLLGALLCRQRVMCKQRLRVCHMDWAEAIRCNRMLALTHCHRVFSLALLSCCCRQMCRRAVQGSGMLLINRTLMLDHVQEVGCRPHCICSCGHVVAA